MPFWPRSPGTPSFETVSKAPLCAIAVQQICNRVMHRLGYHGIFSLFVTDQSGLAETMVQDPRLPLISFTGSVAVGRRIASTVGNRLGRALLELSGNNAVIIDETADLDLAVRAILFGAVGTRQRCTTTRRLLVHTSRMRVTAKLVNAYAHIHIRESPGARRPDGSADRSERR
jgi:aldehyde dehydrogenase (NAD+)